MEFQAKVLAVVAEITDAPAYFYEGTLFVKTTDSAVSVTVFDALWEKITAALAFQKVGDETAYDFLGFDPTEWADIGCEFDGKLV
jgi:hypothetical protein